MSEHYCGKKSEVFCVACDKERAVIEAALDLTSKTMFSAGEINKLATRCAALRAFRERESGR